MRLRRLGAYLLDILIILVVSNIFSGFLPNHDKVIEVSSESSTIISEYFKAIEENSENLDVYVEKLSDCNYELAKVSVFTDIFTVVLYFLYFIVFQMYNNGQTIGKSLLKIEVTSVDDNDITFKQLLIRGIILFPIITTLFNCLLISIFNQSVYDSFSKILMLLELGLVLSCIIPILLNKTGLHEILSKTSVVNTGNNEKDEGKVTKWKNTAEKEQRVKKYRVNHTSGKRKE